MTRRGEQLSLTQVIHRPAPSPWPGHGIGRNGHHQERAAPGDVCLGGAPE